VDRRLPSQILLGTVALFALMVPSASTAQKPGVTGSEILIGSCSALDGPSRMLGLQTVLGASAYIDMVNEQGGINGRKLRLVDYDDSYDPEKAPGCFARLQKDQVFAAGFFVGTPTAAKYVPLAEENKVPVVGLFTGAQLLYEPFRHYVINIRASYFDETREQVDHLWDLGMKRIAVIHPDDAFGAAVLDGVKKALAKHNSAPAADESFRRQTLEVDHAIDVVRSKNPQAVVLVGPYAPVAEIVKRAHARNWRPQFLTVSFVGTDELIKQAGADAEGMIITQVVPPYYLTDLPTVALYRRVLSQHFPNSQPTFVSLEGFVDAMVLVEGLKRAGKDLTREKFIRGVESIHNFDIGLGTTLKLNYGPSDHKGFDSVYATIVTGGKPVIMTDWQQIRH
jgi:branched-chain amino acid transport system substrate-binding protein